MFANLYYFPGESVYYANWTRDAPSGRPYTCATMSSRLQFGWTDEQCNVTKPFVCQFGMYDFIILKCVL